MNEVCKDCFFKDDTEACNTQYLYCMLRKTFIDEERGQCCTKHITRKQMEKNIQQTDRYLDIGAKL